MLISTITDSVTQLEEEYEDEYEENQQLPKSLNISGVSITKQSLSENDQTQSYSDDFESWMSRQTELKENVRKVCDKYGKSLNSEVPLNQFMFDSKHNLLYCRNAKVHKLILWVKPEESHILTRILESLYLVVFTKKKNL